MVYSRAHAYLFSFMPTSSEILVRHFLIEMFCQSLTSLTDIEENRAVKEGIKDVLVDLLDVVCAVERERG